MPAWWRRTGREPGMRLFYRVEKGASTAACEIAGNTRLGHTRAIKPRWAIALGTCKFTITNLMSNMAPTRVQ